MASHPVPQATKLPLERDDHGRPRFHGCSNIREFEKLGKLGEGTFGYSSRENSINLFRTLNYEQ
jgi:serine/threonine-protein kinase BUR1